MRKYLSMVKFNHTIFAFPFAISGFSMGVAASGMVIDWKIFGLVALCMVTARNAAMGFNRYADRNFDSQNPRTAGREIPAGKIKPTQALVFVIANALLFIATTWFINRICFYLSPVALLVILGYSLTKRYTALCHLILGLGLSLAPVGAFLATTGYFALAPVLLSVSVLFWVGGFDIIYALQDEEFDNSRKLFSIPAALGKAKALMVSRAIHLISAIILFVIPEFYAAGMLYYIGAGLFVVLLAYQHTLVRPNNLKKLNLAFFTLNGIASLVFAMFFVADFFCQKY
ncbi:MAG: putative 4-hydroxybenzoate polyprenyltransferase [Bacteroidetes bacterium]|nr:putative 4-hydroxybenzoate polyprenyltransferase [Bacteroidota bacterium]MBU1720864.1 putative 4-hydroxybenzoate polyprenyltransferase [Bacteroidota bacterium]